MYSIDYKNIKKIRKYLNYIKFMQFLTHRQISSQKSIELNDNPLYDVFLKISSGYSIILNLNLL